MTHGRSYHWAYPSHVTRPLQIHIEKHFSSSFSSHLSGGCPTTRLISIDLEDGWWHCLSHSHALRPGKFWASFSGKRLVTSALNCNCVQIWPSHPFPHHFGGGQSSDPSTERAARGVPHRGAAGMGQGHQLFTCGQHDLAMSPFRPGEPAMLAPCEGKVCAG